MNLVNDPLCDVSRLAPQTLCHHHVRQPTPIAKAFAYQRLLVEECVPLLTTVPTRPFPAALTRSVLSLHGWCGEWGLRCRDLLRLHWRLVGVRLSGIRT